MKGMAHNWISALSQGTAKRKRLQEKGPKDEGLALRKKCEEISRHLSTRGKEGDDKKPLDSINRSSDCSTYSFSRPQLSLEQIDGLLGTDLFNYAAVSDHFAEKQGLLNCDRSTSNGAAASLPSFAKSFDDIALFIYKHAFHDLPYDDALRGPSSATSRIVARRRRCQESLLKSGVLRTLARVLKSIHDSNFYRSPEEKIANAFTISIEKHRVDREGLSADWEFYGANHHPKIPPKEKVIYLRISQELSTHPSKRVTLLASNSKKPGLSSVSGNNKKPCIANRRKIIPTSKSAATNKPCNKSTSAQCNVVVKGRQRRVRANSKNRDLPINPFTATPTTEDERRIKQRPSSSSTGTISSEVDSKIRTKGDRNQIVRERPSTTPQSQMTSFAPGSGDSGHHGKAGARNAGAEPRKSKVKLRGNAGDLPWRMQADFTEYSLKNEPDGGLSTLARIEQLFPMPVSHNEKDLQRRTELQVEIERLKILRW